MGGFAEFFIVFFAGIYFAIVPKTYRRGIALLFPKEHEERVEGLLLKVGNTLQLWLLGKLLAIVAVGIFTWLGLWGLGVPLAPVLGLLAAVLTFVPNIGPVIAAIPPLLLAVTQSPITAVYVLLLVLLVQGLETYVLSPYVQKQTVALSPGLTLFVQVTMGVIFGGVGVTVATPLAAAGLVIFDELRVKQRGT